MKSKQVKNIPELRFPEFLNDGEWEENKLKDICQMQAGKFVSASEINEKKINDSLYPCYGGNGLRGYTKSHTHNGEYSLIGRQGALCGNVTFASNKFHATEHAVVVTPKKHIDTNWLYYKLIHLDLNQYATGQAQPGLSVENLERVKVETPKEEKEQQKIADCLSSIDNLITASTKKCETLKQHKKALMQQLFPTDGEEIPKLRFPEFENSGKWEEKILDEVVNRYDNLRVPVSAINRIAGKTPYYGANGIQGYVSGYTHDGEFILVAEDGANDLKDYPIQYVNGKIWVNNHAHVLQAKKDIAYNRFLKFAISKINIEPFLVGGGRAKLNANIMMKLKINIPKLNEQQKIADCLSSIDELITAQSKKVETLKEHKKGLMQQLFPRSEG
ncbi:MAG: hypothetical protein A2513_00625 [Sulfurimonas sp. RIFOXYD12_FULL_33_39]|uniref:restriction endonuclease subunit S n=1 Tax=unclassified Sulfurimonas TaxID=2623549 RepID=UPI0008B37F78|nr:MULTISPECIES: restriction endonuclease subunit S [unclassified Sulfurimonas]OHE10829.1 MAG: hypothetical protein A2513_00625 [Sulfurimonas sp. RIFOXYD12_FULL_33_39]OHE13401.1 MAG: hypothetical protein A2530_07555 [Sulfurimonas sp. RIFOXYD2_FULL_34_21]